MIPIFLGLSLSNVLLLCLVFGLGLGVTNADGGLTSWYAYHMTMGIAAGLMTPVAHLSTFTYFMATSKWLRAATDKGGLDPDRFVRPALAHKRRILGTVMLSITCTSLTAFAGAGVDPTTSVGLPTWVHLGLAVVAVGINLICHGVQFHWIRKQGRLMDQTLVILNQPSEATPASTHPQAGVGC